MDFNTGYCPGCATYVSPGEELITSISYDEFNIPEHLVTANKTLDYAPFTYY